VSFVKVGCAIERAKRTPIVPAPAIRHRTDMDIPRLFDRAKRHTGSDGQTARLLGVDPNRVSEWRNGHRSCPAKVQDKLCVIARLSDREIARHVTRRAGPIGRSSAARPQLAQEFA